MADNRTYPVPLWVRTVVCLAPFGFAAFIVLALLPKDRGTWALYLATLLCGQVIILVLKKR